MPTMAASVCGTVKVRAAPHPHPNLPTHMKETQAMTSGKSLHHRIYIGSAHKLSLFVCRHEMPHDQSFNFMIGHTDIESYWLSM